MSQVRWMIVSVLSPRRSNFTRPIASVLFISVMSTGEPVFSEMRTGAKFWSGCSAITTPAACSDADAGVSSTSKASSWAEATSASFATAWAYGVSAEASAVSDFALSGMSFAVRSAAPGGISSDAAASL